MSNTFHRVLRYLFFLLVVHPILLVVLGLNVRRRERLPRQGPAVIVANHNSHLDAMALITLFGLKRLKTVRPVAAADYFLARRWLRWFSLEIVGIIPLSRSVTSSREDPLAGISEALQRGEIVILFPEGTRGEPEQMEEFKSGVAHVAKRHPEVPVVPIFLHGLGKALPKGEALLVPFFCDVFVGDALVWPGRREAFMDELTARMQALAAEGRFTEWT
jgi:1-acyl-sn-glycerol-3-phosphate acyltransferase